MLNSILSQDVLHNKPKEFDGPFFSDVESSPKISLVFVLNPPKPHSLRASKPLLRCCVWPLLSAWFHCITQRLGEFGFLSKIATAPTLGRARGLGSQ